jgi:hypothetical protein
MPNFLFTFIYKRHRIETDYFIRLINYRDLSERTKLFWSWCTLQTSHVLQLHIFIQTTKTLLISRFERSKRIHAYVTTWSSWFYVANIYQIAHRLFRSFWFLFCEAAEIWKNGDNIFPFRFNALGWTHSCCFFQYSVNGKCEYANAFDVSGDDSMVQRSAYQNSPLWSLVKVCIRGTTQSNPLLHLLCWPKFSNQVDYAYGARYLFTLCSIETNYILRLNIQYTVCHIPLTRLSWKRSVTDLLTLTILRIYIIIILKKWTQGLWNIVLKLNIQLNRII